MNKYFDVLVIGSGSAGSSIAIKCAGAGLNTAIVDCRPYGGTCAIRGCDPKKILVDVASYVDMKKRLPGLIGNTPLVEWTDLLIFKKSFTDPVPARREQAYKRAKITMLKGKATFDSAHSLVIGDDRFSAKKIVIATGAKPQKLNIEGEDYLTYSHDFFELEKLPEKILFVGGGFISFEFAHIAARFGSKAVILHTDNHPLDMFDREMVSMLLSYSKSVGIDVILNSEVKKIEKENGKFLVKAGPEKFTADLVVHGAGRVADIDKLGLEAANVDYNKGIIVNEYMQSTTNENIYCAGDASAGSAPLTPVAGAEAKIAAENIINGNIIKKDLGIIPYALFTIPPLASVGISEQAAIEKNLDFKKNYSDTSKWYHSKKTGFKGTGFKVLTDKSTELIIGAHLFLPEAENTINLFAMAMHSSLTAAELKDMIFTYPSVTSDLKYMV